MDSNTEQVINQPEIYLNDSIKHIIFDYFIPNNIDRIPAEINTIATLCWYLNILRYKYDDVVSRRLFHKLCYCGKLKLALWVKQTYRLPSSICTHHDYLGITHFKQINAVKSFKSYSEGDTFTIKDNPFMFACIIGDIELAEQSFYEYMYITKSDYTISYKYIFNAICFSDHLDMAKWFAKRILMQKDGYLFRTVCELGHLDIAKWLVKEFKIIRPDVPEEETLAESVRENGHMDTVKWLEDEMGITEGIRH